MEGTVPKMEGNVYEFIPNKINKHFFFFNFWLVVPFVLAGCLMQVAGCESQFGTVWTLCLQ